MYLEFLLLFNVKPPLVHSVMKTTQGRQGLFPTPENQIRLDRLLGFLKGRLHERLSVHHHPVAVPDSFHIIAVRFILFSPQPECFGHLSKFAHVELVREMIEKPNRGQVFRLAAGPSHRNPWRLWFMIGFWYIVGVFKPEKIGLVDQWIKGAPFELQGGRIDNGFEN